MNKREAVSCERCGKRPFSTPEDAEESARQIQMDGGPEMYCYWSDECAKYHLSTASKR